MKWWNRLFTNEFDRVVPIKTIDVDPHASCRMMIRTLEQQRDSAFALMNQATDRAIHMAGEIVRLSQLHVPVVPTGELEELPSTRDNDHVAGITLNDPENLRRPKQTLGRVDE